MKAKTGPSRTLFQVSGWASPLHAWGSGCAGTGPPRAGHQVGHGSSHSGVLGPAQSSAVCGTAGTASGIWGCQQGAESPECCAEPRPTFSTFLSHAARLPTSLPCLTALPPLLLLLPFLLPPCCLWIAVLSSENCSFHGPDGQALVPALLRCELQRGESPVVAARR